VRFLKIAHKKPECIGCMLCAEVAPNYWEMDEDDEAQLLRVTREDKAFQYGEGFEEDRDLLKEAEAGCPMDTIKIG